MSFLRARIGIQFDFEPDVGWHVSGFSTEACMDVHEGFEMISFGTHWENPTPEVSGQLSAAGFLAEIELARLVDRFGEARHLF